MYRYSFPTTIHFGSGTTRLIGDHLKSQKIKRPLLVTDKGIASLPLCLQLEKELQNSDFKVKLFSEIWGNPVKSQVNAGVKAYLQHDADGVIGLGGGAALDVAKAIVLMAHHPGDLFDYEDEKPGARPIDQKIPYWIAIPTTSGTGSEVGRSSVISDDKTHLKKIIFSPRLIAQAVFADPDLTIDLPAPITAATGMDALTHCVEAYLAKNYHPICDGIALEGIRLCSESLVETVKTPHSKKARGSMMMASMMGAIAFQKGLGVTHSCAHALGTVEDMHHGLANGVMIDFALSFNLKAVPERFKNMSQTVGLNKTDGESFIYWLKDLKTKLSIPQNLTQAKVTTKNLDRLVQVAYEDSCHQNNPCQVSKEDFYKIFSGAF